MSFVDYSLIQGGPAGHESAGTPTGHESVAVIEDPLLLLFRDTLPWQRRHLIRAQLVSQLIYVQLVLLD